MAQSPGWGPHRKERARQCRGRWCGHTQWPGLREGSLAAQQAPGLVSEGKVGSWGSGLWVAYFAIAGTHRAWGTQEGQCLPDQGPRVTNTENKQLQSVQSGADLVGLRRRKMVLPV